MAKMDRVPDHSLEHLLDLHGQVLVISADGQYWVKFEVTRVPITAAKPHGLNYSLTLHGPTNERLLGFDNSHPVPPTKQGEPQDHQHIQKSVKPYQYKNAAALLRAFWTDVDAMLEKLGVR
jgi:hypothetical protein